MSTAIAQKTTLAVVNLEGIGISQTEAIALSNRLRNELFRSKSYKVVTRGLMEEILLEQDLQQTGCISDECLVTVGKILGVQQIIGGSISRIGGMFTVSAMVIDVETGEVLKVSDLDMEGRLEDVLTIGMKRIVMQITGIEGGEVTLIPAQPTTKVNASPQPPRIQKPPRIVVEGKGRYYRNGKRIWTMRGFESQLLSLGDAEIARLVGVARKSRVGVGFHGGFVGLWSTLGSVYGIVETDDIGLSLLLVAIGINGWRLAIKKASDADKAHETAVTRYNSLVSRM